MLQAPSFVTDLAWQSTVLLGVGLIAARCLRKRPARAHAVLTASLLAALLTPLVSHVVRSMNWGLLPSDVLLTLGGVPPTVSAAGAVAASGPSLTEWLTWIWSALALALGLRLTYQILVARGYLRGARPLDVADLRAQLDEARERLGLATDPELYTTPKLTSPVIWGWSRKPRIYLPARTHDIAHWRAVLCHELAHYKRRDHWSALLTEVATCFLAFHPLFWLHRRALLLQSEYASDAWVLAVGETPADYAESLLRLRGGRQPVLALSARRHGLVARVTAILNSDCHTPQLGWTWRGTLVLGAIAAVASFGLAQAGAPLLVELQDKHELPRAEPSTIDVLPAAVRELVAETRGLQVVPAELDFGEVAPETSANGSLWILNGTDEPARLLGAQPTCGCVTLANLRNLTVAPGQVVELPLAMKAPPTPGKAKTQHVLIAFEGQQPLKIPVHIRAGGSTE